MNIFINLAAIVPYIFLWGFFLIAVFFFFQTKNNRSALRRPLTILFWIAAAFRIIYAVFLTIGQYVFWGGSPETKIFLQQGIDESGPLGALVKIFPFLGGELGYFAFYAFMHFWLGAFVAILCALLFWWFLKMLHKYRERFFEDGEKELGATLALLAGWPNFILFIVIAFVCVLLISLTRGVVYKEPYTTLGLPFLIATLMLLLFGKILLFASGLSVLRITNISL